MKIVSKFQSEFQASDQNFDSEHVRVQRVLEAESELDYTLKHIRIGAHPYL